MNLQILLNMRSPSQNSVIVSLIMANCHKVLPRKWANDLKRYM